MSHTITVRITMLPHIFGDGHLTSQQIKEFVNCKLTVEDEIHFLLECPKLDELMKQDMTIYIILRINTKISNLWLMLQSLYG